MLRTAAIFLLTVMVGTVLVSIANTHVDLQALTDLGAEFSTQARIESMQRDLTGLGPSLAAMLTVGFALAFPVAGWLARWLGRPWRRIGYTLAGGLAVACAMLALTAIYGETQSSLITPIASSRTLPGLLSLALGGSAAGLFFALLKPAAPRH